MAKTWEKWYDEVLPDVPHCPQPVAKNAIRNAAIEFCERSFVYQADHPAIAAVQDQGEYTYAPGTGLKVVRPEMVWYDKKQLTPMTRDDLDRLYAYWPDESGTPIYFVQEQLEKLIVVPKPAAALADAIRLKVSVKPTRASVDIDDAMHEKYLEAIACGAKARLFAMKKKPWTDNELAVYHKQMFDAAIATARLHAARGHTRARMRVRAHFF
jgi:hypothetical protein